jgi:hypothetical protein
LASALWTSLPAAGEELHLAARQTACTSLDPLLKNAVSKETRYEALKTLSRNHRGRQRPLVEGANRLSFKDPGKAGPGIGGGSDDGHSSVPNVWH